MNTSSFNANDSAIMITADRLPVSRDAGGEMKTARPEADTRTIEISSRPTTRSLPTNRRTGAQSSFRLPDSSSPNGPDGGKKSPVLLKIAIVSVTVIALFMVVRACNEITASGPGGANGSGGSAAGTSSSTQDGANGGSPAPETAREDGAVGGGTPAPSGPDDKPSMGDSSSPSKSPAAQSPADTLPAVPRGGATIAEDIRDTARAVRLSEDLTADPMPDGTSVYKAILGQALWEARTLQALAAPFMPAEERARTERFLGAISEYEDSTPYFRENIRLATKCSAEMTCRLVAGLVADGSLAESAIQMQPSDADDYRIGYPADLGAFAECQIRAWCLLLRDSGKLGGSKAQRIEAELASLPASPSLARSTAAMDLSVRTIADVGAALRQWNASTRVLDQIEAQKKREIDRAQGIFPQYLALLRARTATLRHVATGEAP